MAACGICGALAEYSRVSATDPTSRGYDRRRVGRALLLCHIYWAVTWKAVNVAVTPVWIVMRSPLEPDWNALSVAVTIQVVGSALPAGQTRADRLVPTTRNRRL